MLPNRDGPRPDVRKYQRLTCLRKERRGHKDKEGGGKEVTDMGQQNQILKHVRREEVVEPGGGGRGWSRVTGEVLSRLY